MKEQKFLHCDKLLFLPYTLFFALYILKYKILMVQLCVAIFERLYSLLGIKNLNVETEKYEKTLSQY